ncbi:hypothetical protein MHYP_G00167440 [Metynnis hypsauchen]
MATEYLECHLCRKKVAGWSQDILEQLDPAHRAMFPAILTYSYIGWLRQVHCRPGGRLYAIKEEVLRLDAEKWKAAKFCPPRWPPVVSIMERERRKRARRELEWVGTVEASAQDPQLSSRRSRPHTHSQGHSSKFWALYTLNVSGPLSMPVHEERDQKKGGIYLK